MKKFIIYGWLTVILLPLPFLSACHSSDITTSAPPKTIMAIPELPPIATLVPTVDRQSPAQTPQAPDDIVTVPGGAAYRANVHQEGVPDKWPSISPTSIQLDNAFERLNVNYRYYINTKAGETRNNIIEASLDTSNTAGPLSNHELILYSMAVLDGITLGQFGGGGIPGTTKAVLTIDLSPGIALGEHNFDIGIEFDGVYFGAIPCTVNVVK
jgi:hypothetical protein